MDPGRIFANWLVSPTSPMVPLRITPCSFYHCSISILILQEFLLQESSIAFCATRTIGVSSSFVQSLRPRSRCVRSARSYTWGSCRPLHMRTCGRDSTHGSCSCTHSMISFLPGWSHLGRRRYPVYLRIMLIIGKNPSTSSVVKKCRGVRLIFAEYWAKIVRSDGLLVHIGMFGHSDGLIDMSQIIIFLVGAGVSSAENWEELLAGVGGRDELAYLLGKNIGIALARPLVDDIAMGLSATLSLIQRTGDDRPFHKAMLSHGVAKALVAAVGALDVYPNRQLVELGKQMGLGALMQHFDDLEDRSGYQWTTQALDGGLLNMVVSMGIRAKEATVFSVDNSYPFLVELLKRILPEALGFYPVVRQMKKSFPVVLPLSTAATFRTAAAFKLWKPFANMVEQRLQALEFFDSGRWISSKACDNLECGKIDDKPKFRRCSGCCSLYYCSAECQKKDWKSGHRKRCRTLRVSQLLHPSTPGERAYLRALLQYNWEFLSVKSAVLFLQAQFMYKNPGVEFFTLFDLAKGERDPDWIDIRPMSKFPTGSDDFFRTAQGGRCIQQHAVLMKGLPSPMFRFFPFTFSSSDLNDALLRIVKAIPGLGSSALANHLVGPVSELSSSSEGKEFY
ncbi:hypothetical protein FB451DRAFT_373856 [Mycena latifolia]|nr:hypothetical protein FB451DRAFT_373856 [Mycena latifolia]